MNRLTRGLLAAVGVAGIGAAVLLVGSTKINAADHGDSASVASTPKADALDLYAWMSTDGNRVNLILTVNSDAGSSATFDDSADYAFHVESSATVGGTATNTDAICRFNSAGTEIECWVGDSYVKGDPSATAGLDSDDGKIKVYAGLRDDPFFFNAAGFGATVSTTAGAAGSLSFNATYTGCPILTDGTAEALVGLLASDGSGGAGVNAFGGQNVLAIVLSVDKTLVNGGGDILGVWASTHTRN